MNGAHTVRSALAIGFQRVGAGSHNRGARIVRCRPRGRLLKGVFFVEVAVSGRNTGTGPVIIAIFAIFTPERVIPCSG